MFDGVHLPTNQRNSKKPKKNLGRKQQNSAEHRRMFWDPGILAVSAVTNVATQTDALTGGGKRDTKGNFSSSQFCIGKMSGEAEGMILRNSKQDHIHGLKSRYAELGGKKTPKCPTSVPGTNLEMNSKTYHICPYVTIKERVNVDFREGNYISQDITSK